MWCRKKKTHSKLKCNDKTHRIQYIKLTYDNTLHTKKYTNELVVFLLKLGIMKICPVMYTIISFRKLEAPKPQSQTIELHQMLFLILINCLIYDSYIFYPHIWVRVPSFFDIQFYSLQESFYGCYKTAEPILLTY